MTGIRSDSHVNLDGASVSVTGITALCRDALAVGVAAQDLTELNVKLARPIAALAKTLAPRKTGRMAASIKPSRSKLRVMVRAGSDRKPFTYTGMNHWGITAHNGPEWLSHAEERLRTQTFAGFGEGIAALLTKYNW